MYPFDLKLVRTILIAIILCGSIVGCAKPKGAVSVPPRPLVPEQKPADVLIRAIVISGPQNAELPSGEIQKAWADRGIKLRVDDVVTSSTLNSSAAEAAKAIEQRYRDVGRSVRVTNEIQPLPPRSVSVTFTVVEAVP